MTRQEFAQLCQKIVVLDGAMGTLLQAAGLPLGDCPEKWLLQHRDVMREIQEAYVSAGSDILYVPSFGANRIKLANYGLEGQAVEINTTLAAWTREHASTTLIAGNLSSTGLQVAPFGPTPFAELVDVYKEQVQALLAGQVDLFAIETMTDIQEARAALLAVKESCNLPAIVTMTFDERGRTLTGSDPLSCLIILQSLGADAVGLNCSSGPEAMVPLLERLYPYAQVPLVVKPNAGLPKLVAGQTIFDMDPETFATATAQLVAAGATLVGGCCGTTPAHIRSLRQSIGGQPATLGQAQGGCLASFGHTLDLHSSQETLLVGERINPTGKKKLQAELAAGSMNLVRQFGREQQQAGAAILDVNVALGDGQEAERMEKAIAALTSLNIPLCIDSSDPDVVAQALRLYPGRALVNSVPLEKAKTDQLLQICAHYGAAVLLLPISDQGVPQTLAERKQNITALLAAARGYGIAAADCIIDGLAMTVSANPEDAGRTLDTIAWCRDSLGCASIIGLSNVSFGLPQRAAVNTAFLAMAVQHGLSLVIANPAAPGLVAAKTAADLLSGRDPDGRRYLQWHRDETGNSSSDAGRKTAGPGSANAKTQTADDLTGLVLDGRKEETASAIAAALAADWSAADLLQQVLMPAITQVGDLFDEGTYFLPQLIASAEAMETAVAALQPHLTTAGDRASTADNSDRTIVMASVKGDVHDIGKNLVCLLLRNHGYRVVDLGKNVEAADIATAVQKEKASLVGLSALMTTTMPEMEKTIACLRQQGLDIPVIIGGAAVSPDFAERIGAAGYGRDASAAVRLAAGLLLRVPSIHERKKDFHV